MSKTPPYYYDEDAAQRPVYFIEKYCKHLHGDKAGGPFLLEDWQAADIVKPIFGWKNANGTRKHKFAYIEVPKGNGKSYLLSGVALYMAAFDGENNGEIYCVAGDKEQAKIIFNTCKEMVKADKALSKAFQIRRDHIEHKKSASKIHVISAEAYSKHGYRPHLIAFDELHVQKNRELYDTLTRGLIKRPNSLCIMITTAGVKNSFGETIHDYAAQIESKKVENPAWYVKIYAASEDDDPFSESTWLKANPGLRTGILDLATFRILALEAQQQPTALNAFKQLHLNQWTGSAQSWIPAHDWAKVQGQLPPDDYLAGLPLFLGLDKSSTKDLTCLSCIWYDEENEVYYLRVFTFCPEATIYERVKKENINYRAWVEAGWIIATEGNTQDDRAIKNKVLELMNRGRVACFAYDPWAAANIAAELYTDYSLPVMKISQTLSVLSAPTKWFEKQVYENAIIDDSNPVFAWAMDNVTVKGDGNDNRRPHKGESKGRIDPVAATVTAAAGLLDWQAKNKDSIYNREDLKTL